MKRLMFRVESASSVQSLMTISIKLKVGKGL